MGVTICHPQIDLESKFWTKAPTNLPSALHRQNPPSSSLPHALQTFKNMGSRIRPKLYIAHFFTAISPPSLGSIQVRILPNEVLNLDISPGNKYHWRPRVRYVYFLGMSAREIVTQRYSTFYKYKLYKVLIERNTRWQSCARAAWAISAGA